MEVVADSSDSGHGGSSGSHDSSDESDYYSDDSDDSETNIDSDESDDSETNIDSDDSDMKQEESIDKTNQSDDIEPDELEEHYYTKASFYGDFGPIISINGSDHQLNYGEDYHESNHLGVLKEITDLEFVNTNKLPTVTCNATFYGLGAENWKNGKRDILFSMDASDSKAKFNCLAKCKVIWGFSTSGIQNRCFSYYRLKYEELLWYMCLQKLTTGVEPAYFSVQELPDSSFSMRYEDINLSRFLTPYKSLGSRDLNSHVEMISKVSSILSGKEIESKIVMVNCPHYNSANDETGNDATVSHNNDFYDEKLLEEYQSCPSCYEREYVRLREELTNVVRSVYELKRNESSNFYNKNKKAIDKLKELEQEYKGSEQGSAIPAWWLDWDSFRKHYHLEVTVIEGDKVVFSKKNTAEGKFVSKVMKIFAGEDIDDDFIKGLVKYGFIEPKYEILNFEVEDDRLKIRGDKDPYMKDVFYVISTSFAGKEFNKKELYKFSDLAEYIKNSLKFTYATEYVADPGKYSARYEFTIDAYSVSDPSVKTATPVRLWFSAYLDDKEYTLLIEDHKSKSDKSTKKVKKIIYVKRDKNSYLDYL